MASCPLCTKVFKTKQTFDLHVTSHTKEKPYKCPTCSAAFGTPNYLKKHIRRVHDGITQTKSKNTRCLLCSYKCYNKSLLRSHMRIHSAGRQFPCSVPGCGFKTKHENYLQQHVRGFHNNERSYECHSEGCNFKAKSKTNLTTHLKTHSNEKPFACPFPGCNYTCKANYDLTAHTSGVHCDDRPFKCSTCDYRAKRKEHLILHQRTHEKVKRFQCQAPYCGFASHQKHKLKQHFNRIHGRKDVLCTATGCNFRCGATFLLKEHLKRHKNVLLKCPYDSCNFRTGLKKSLRSHISLRHEEFLSEGNERKQRKHVCTFCLARFTTLYDLRAHLKTHTGEKPYRCSHCNFATAFSMQLRIHAEKMHHILVIHGGKEEDEAIKCRTCNMSFWNYSALVLHSMSHLQPVVVLELLDLRIM